MLGKRRQTRVSILNGSKEERFVHLQHRENGPLDPNSLDLRLSQTARCMDCGTPLQWYTSVLNWNNFSFDHKYHENAETSRHSGTCSQRAQRRRHLANVEFKGKSHGSAHQSHARAGCRMEKFLSLKTGPERVKIPHMGRPHSDHEIKWSLCRSASQRRPIQSKMKIVG